MRVLLILMLIKPALAFTAPELIYQHPKPKAEWISPQTTILFRLKESADVPPEFKVIGSASGRHVGEVIQSENTFIFKPDRPCAEFERIAVNVHAPQWQQQWRWQFTTGEHPATYAPPPQVSKTTAVSRVNTSGEIKKINGVAVPHDFPEFQPSIRKEGRSTKRLFLSNWSGTNYFFILDEDGTPYFYQRAPVHTPDFKLQPIGYLSRFTTARGRCFIGLDSTYREIKIFKPAHGYSMDEHELLWLENGHYLFICYGYRNVDMSEIVTGGNSKARVKDCIIQEFDENDNLIFQWSSADYFDIRDVDHVNLRAEQIDWVHMNSLAVDYDGNLVFSNRNLSEVTKIDRQTGEIMWRFSGANNQFQFVNDDHQTSYQHDARPVPGKPNHYTIFDNGNYHSPHFSRAVEFVLDTETMTATKVWEYRLQEGRTPWLGNARRLPNGNTFINWADKSVPKAMEVTPDGTVVYKGDFVVPDNCYRTYRFDWESVAPRPVLFVEYLGDNLGLIFDKFGDETIKTWEIYSTVGSNALTLLDSTDKNYYVVENPQNKSRHFFRVRAVDENGRASEFSDVEKVYVSNVPAGENMLSNGSFDGGTIQPWEMALNEADASMQVNNKGELAIDITDGGSIIWGVQVRYTMLPLVRGQSYVFEFDAYSTGNKPVDAKLEKDEHPWHNYGSIGSSIITRRKRHFRYEFTMQHNTDLEARLVFNCGSNNHNLYIDNVSLTRLATSVAERETAPNSFAVQQNYPNPFNAGTTLCYQLPAAGDVKILIYNVLGETVRSAQFSHSPGEHQWRWNGKNDLEFPVPSGVYFYQMTFDDGVNRFQNVGKMMMVR